ncbi:dTDP-4-dehydrorhamnose reductase [uncultured Aquimarina sp.]|uniref:dTDP-4-dehydrorhamnose reductase n=1 Tax=uncultured Aquimarina sp. TaxID=575652 RepID=UPI00262E6094|nr:dTDP-4-dehydrorhamnose reductase [uncultured Aquimarina sp.]
MKILVTGSDGQLGRCIHLLAKKKSNIDFFFTNSLTLDITDKNSIEYYFLKNNIDYVINCAAYTNVEEAEKEPKKALLVNAEGVKNIAEICKKHDVTLLHISTDYVFDGKKNTHYTEEDEPKPINKYGKSKLFGEMYVQEILDKHFIIRTSWLYSQFGKNFFKTISEKSNVQDEFTITTAEKGTPTNANDLALFLLEIIEQRSSNYGVYHFSNLGSATWYDFAKEILILSGKLGEIRLKKTDNYPTFAKRPVYSVLSKRKIIENFDFDILNWKESLKKLINT